ncbi:hypothetical protein V5799_009557 [Amblyomma americanum]|uniref:Uncharacterized protein n=1 Tax=Amblyomma americanum TaxID=6943 RepID=A0AAQ4FBE7_AMBAM
MPTSAEEQRVKKDGGGSAQQREALGETEGVLARGGGRQSTSLCERSTTRMLRAKTATTKWTDDSWDDLLWAEHF